MFCVCNGAHIQICSPVHWAENVSEGRERRTFNVTKGFKEINVLCRSGIHEKLTVVGFRCAEWWFGVGRESQKASWGLLTFHPVGRKWGVSRDFRTREHFLKKTSPHANDQAGQNRYGG